VVADAKGVGADPVAESFMTCPTRIKLAFVIPLRLIRVRVVVPKREAIPLRESPGATVYVELGAGAAGAGAELGEEAVALGDGLDVGLGEEAVALGDGLDVGLGEEAVALGDGLGEGKTLVSNPFTSVYFPAKDAIA
jgi:hypothetical protein